jgi:hypothetical protein
VGAMTLTYNNGSPTCDKCVSVRTVHISHEWETPEAGGGHQYCKHCGMTRCNADSWMPCDYTISHGAEKPKVPQISVAHACIECEAARMKGIHPSHWGSYMVEGHRVCGGCDVRHCDPRVHERCPAPMIPIKQTAGPKVATTVRPAQVQTCDARTNIVAVSMDYEDKVHVYHGDGSSRVMNVADVVDDWMHVCQQLERELAMVRALTDRVMTLERKRKVTP